MPIIVTNPFKGRQYPGDVIQQAVRWYLRYPLAYEHVAELLSRAGPGSGRQLCLALGTSLLAGIEQALPTPSQAHEQELPCRRDLYKG
jgi:hypothetical protein